MNTIRKILFDDEVKFVNVVMEVHVSNRYLCEVLEEIRSCNKTRNFAPLEGLVEECQTLANRMEAGLSDKKNVLSYEHRRPILKDEIKELEWTRDELEEEIRKMKFKIKELNHNNPQLSRKLT